MGDLEEPDQLQPVQSLGARLVAMDLRQPCVDRRVGRDQAVDVDPSAQKLPVHAEPDPHLARAGQAMATVADLLKRHAVPPSSVEAGHDTDLARSRIAECLFVGAHATALGLGEQAARL